MQHDLVTRVYRSADHLGLLLEELLSLLTGLSLELLLDRVERLQVLHVELAFLLCLLENSLKLLLLHKKLGFQLLILVLNQLLVVENLFRSSRVGEGLAGRLLILVALVLALSLLLGLHA